MSFERYITAEPTRGAPLTHIALSFGQMGGSVTVGRGWPIKESGRTRIANVLRAEAHRNLLPGEPVRLVRKDQGDPKETKP